MYVRVGGGMAGVGASAPWSPAFPQTLDLLRHPRIITGKKSVENEAAPSLAKGLAPANLLQPLTGNIFLVTSQWDTQVGKQLRQSQCPRPCAQDMGELVLTSETRS